MFAQASYIKKIEWLLSCNDSNLSEQTVALLTERNDAIKNYRNKILCTEQLTAHQEEIISSVIHMFCNRLTGDRSLEQKYLNIMREGLSNIIEKGKRNPINEHYSKRIASLFQDFIKYDATFRENIAYGNLDLMDKDAELRDLSNEFRIGHIIDHSKQNLDTQLGYWFDEGKQISFGEWQKLAIARTFSKDADVIFLDEPNSALDAISDYEISQLYQKLFQDKMGIIIAHKFNNLINQVNNILVIENGRLAESGTHTDLLHQGKIYYEMYQLQNKNSAVL